MKLRIKDNSLRLRLTQSEVIQFGKVGKIESSMQLPDGSRFIYALYAHDTKVSDVIFDKSILKVLIPVKEVESWVHSDRVGIEKSLLIGKENHLKVWVEKDFKCLTTRLHEDESDHFENPGTSH